MHLDNLLTRWPNLGVAKASYHAIYDGHLGIDCCEYLEKHLHIQLLNDLAETQTLNVEVGEISAIQF